MLYSKARIEFSEEMRPGVFNHVLQESGTLGDSDLGQDIGVVAKETPRPLLLLAEAIEYVMKFSKNQSHPLYVAALKYIKTWSDYDTAVGNGADPLSLPWPDGRSEG